MKFEWVPLLQFQRDLYAISNGQERFQKYLETMMNSVGSDVELMPMVSMNPMGQAHIPELLDTLLEMNAETIAADALTEVPMLVSENQDLFKIGIVVVDDLLGGWTNRYTCEFSDRFELEPRLKRGWVSVILWTSELPTVQRVRTSTLTAWYRTVYVRQHGVARTLQEMMTQEGYAMKMSGCLQPMLDKDDVAYTQDIISFHLLAQDYPTLIACLYGDHVAQLLGYIPLGLSERAGLALALYQAKHVSETHS